MAELTEELYESIRKSFHEGYLRDDGGRFTFLDCQNDCAYFGWVKANGNTNIYNSTACHYGLKVAPKNCMYIVSSIQRGGYSSMGREWMDFLVNHSVYKDLFVTRDIDKIMYDRFFLLHTEGDRNFTASCCIASRISWEWPAHCKHILDLHKGGVNPCIALLLGSLANERNGVISFTNNVYGHHVVNSNWAIGTAVRYFEGKYTKTASFITIPGYDNIQGMWGGEKHGGSVGAWVEKLCVNHIKEVLDTYVHPFPKYSKLDKVKGLSRDNWVEVIKSIEPKLLGGVEA